MPYPHGPKIDWNQVRQEIVARLDPLEEFKKLGLKVPPGARPSESGWITVHSPYGKDKNPSASLYVGTAPGRGLLIDRSAGQERKFNFWTVYVDLGGAHDFKDAFGKLAKQTGVKSGIPRELTERDVRTGYEALIDAGGEEPKYFQLMKKTRGISWDTAKDRQFGWHQKRESFMLPIRGPEGELLRIKLHRGNKATGKSKASFLRSAPQRPLFGAERLAKIKAGALVVITEGELDAALCEQETALCSVSPTGGCKSFRSEFVPQFHEKHVVICFDSDAEGREGSDRVAECFRAAVASQDVLSLRSLQIYKAQSKDRKDVTDFIVKDGHKGKELRELLQKAPRWEYKVKVIETGGEEVKNAAIADPENGRTVVPGDGDEVMANFWIEILEDVTIRRQTGETSRHITCMLRSKHWKEKIELPAADFGDNRTFQAAIHEAAGSSAVFDPRMIPQIRIAGQKASKSVKRTKRIEAFGVIQGTGKHLYVSPTVTIEDGKILPTIETGVQVDFSESALHKKAAGRLDFALLPKGEVKALLKDGLKSFLALYTIEIGGAMLANVALAIAQDLEGVAGVIDARVATWLVGPSGSGKTDLALLAMRFFGPFGKNDMPSWADTANSVEREMAACNSAVIVADDWKSDLLHGSALDKAKRVVQSYASGRARHRLYASGEFADTPPIRSQLIITGEDEPQGQTSITARGLWLDSRKINKDVGLYFAVREISRRFNGITPYLVSYLHRVGAATVIERFTHYSEAFEKQALQTGIEDDNLHRMAQNLALMAGGFRLFMDFVDELGVDEWSGVDKFCKSVLDTFVNGLQGRIRQYLQAIQSERPAETFLEALRTLLATNKARIIDAEQRDTGGGLTLDADFKGNSNVPIVGYRTEHWYEDGFRGKPMVFIVPSTALAEVNQHLKRERGAGLNFSMKAVAQGLEGLGCLFEMDKDAKHNTIRLMVNRHRVRVWKFAGEAIEGLNAEREMQSEIEEWEAI